MSMAYSEALLAKRRRLTLFQETCVFIDVRTCIHETGVIPNVAQECRWCSRPASIRRSAPVPVSMVTGRYLRQSSAHEEIPRIQEVTQDDQAICEEAGRQDGKEASREGRCPQDRGQEETGQDAEVHPTANRDVCHGSPPDSLRMLPRRARRAHVRPAGSREQKPRQAQEVARRRRGANTRVKGRPPRSYRREHPFEIQVERRRGGESCPGEARDTGRGMAPPRLTLDYCRRAGLSATVEA